MTVTQYLPIPWAHIRAIGHSRPQEARSERQRSAGEAVLSQNGGGGDTLCPVHVAAAAAGWLPPPHTLEGQAILGGQVIRVENHMHDTSCGPLSCAPLALDATPLRPL